jgi:hypothetical protein
MMMICDKTLIIFNSCYLRRGKRNRLYCTVPDTSLTQGASFVLSFYICLQHTNLLFAPSLKQFCGSCCDSGMIRILLPDPDRYQFQAKLIKYTFFPRKFQYAVQNTENVDTFDTYEKDKPL